MNPSRPFILRPVATSLLMAAIFLVGLVSYTQLPVSALPEVDYPTIQVLTFYPGASPDVMASTVTAPLERQFGEMQGLSQMTSTSSGGVSVIVLQFNLSLNIDIAEEEVQSAINASQSFLPSNLPAPPTYSKTNPADAPVLTLAITSGSVPLSQVEDLVDTRLAPKLSQLNGVGLVSISGGQKPAVRIQANPVALASYGIDLESLRTALTQTSVNAAKGNFDGPRQDYQIDANDQLVTSKDYRNVVVAYRNGAPVMLTDVAQIVDGIENNNQAAWMNQTPAVILNVQRQPGANTIKVVQSIQRLLPQLEVNLPASVQVTTLTDLSTSIQASVDDVEFELMLTIGLVVLVIFLFLRSVYATIIPSVAVPLSLIGTFAVMYILGYSLDNLSLMALTISTGFVVDDAIVMVENISRYIERGDKPMEAALKGAEQIGFTILSLTVALIAVLIPLLFMGDVVGRLFREFAVTLAVTIVVSAVVSLTLTPMMSSRILRAEPGGAAGPLLSRFGARRSSGMIAFYGHGHSSSSSAIRRLPCWSPWPRWSSRSASTSSFPKGSSRSRIPASSRAFRKRPPTHRRAGHGSKPAGLRQGDPRRPCRPQPLVVHRGRRHQYDDQQRPPLDQPEAARRARSSVPPDVIRRLEPKLADVQGIQLFMEPVQDITVDDRVEPHAVSVHPGRPRPRRADHLDAQPLRRTRWRTSCPSPGGRGSQFRPAAGRPGCPGAGHRPRHLCLPARHRARQPIDNTLYDAFGQRSDQHHVRIAGEPVSRGARELAALPGRDPRRPRPPLHPGQCVVRCQRRSRRLLLRCLRFLLRRLECSHRHGSVHALGQHPHASRHARSQRERHDDEPGINLRRHPQLDHEPGGRRAALRRGALREDHRRRSPSLTRARFRRRHHLLQPRAERLAQRRHRGGRHGAEGPASTCRMSVHGSFRGHRERIFQQLARPTSRS